MPSISEKRCDTCQYFLGQPNQDGECRRYPPSAVGRIPIRVRPEHWCGKFMPALDVPKQDEDNRIPF